MKTSLTIDMTHGPLLGKILLFSLPLMATNLLQMLFNAVDIVVVGRFAGYGSLAAVGSTSSIIFLITNLLIGISIGVNVVIARYLGEGGRDKEISQAIHTAVLIALVGGTFFGTAGFLAAGPALTAVDTPEDIYDLALIYLRIYFLGTPFVMLYNYGTAALRAMGDTRRPLLYLLLSGGTNLALNLYFVIVLHMDAAGVALATVLNQMLSAALVLVCLIRARDAFHFSWKLLRLDKYSLTRMAQIGIPAGIQSCMFSLSNVAIQGAINSYDSVVVAGCSAGASIENFLYVSMNAFHHASQTFISQNIGAAQYGRIKKIVTICLVCTLVLGVCQSGAVLCFAPELVRIYNKDPAVVAAGTVRLWIVASLYVVFGFADVLMGTIRGCGDPTTPVIINLLGTCVLRVIWVWLLDTERFGVELVYLSYPVTWLIILVVLAIYWRYFYRKVMNNSPSKE